MPRMKKDRTGCYQKAFPVRLREILNERHITQAELGAAIGKSRQSVSYYCDGSVSPDLGTVSSIASYFGVSIDWLSGLTESHDAETSVIDLIEKLFLATEIECNERELFGAPVASLLFLDSHISNYLLDRRKMKKLLSDGVIDSDIYSAWLLGEKKSRSRCGNTENGKEKSTL